MIGSHSTSFSCEGPHARMRHVGVALLSDWKVTSMTTDEMQVLVRSHQRGAASPSQIELRRQAASAAMHVKCVRTRSNEATVAVRITAPTTSTQLTRDGQYRRPLVRKRNSPFDHKHVAIYVTIHECHWMPAPTKMFGEEIHERSNSVQNGRPFKVLVE